MQTLTTFEPLRPWRTHPRETVGAAILGAIGLIVLGGTSDAMPLLPQFARQAQLAAAPALPKPLPTEIRDLAPETALAVNAQIPLAGGPNPAAAPFQFGKSTAETRGRALECLTSAIYYEAAQEPTDGQRAVAQVVINRVRHPAFPNSICGVVYEGSTRATGCQFTFTCDGSMAYAPVPSLWNRARKVAEAALGGYVYAPVGYATHYHADYVVPYWASSVTKTLVAGAHIFYRWPGGWGQPAAFNGRYIGEPRDPLSMRPPPPALNQAIAIDAVASVVGPVTDGTILKHAPDDVGGLLDASKGWTLNIPAPGESDSAAAKLIAAQKGASATAQVAASGAAGPALASR